MKAPAFPTPSRYIDLLSDYGFKRIFGSDPNKDLLIHFLNEIFQGRKHIVDIQYDKNEHPGDGPQQGTVIFDLLCTGDKGEKFLIEVQRAKQMHFSHRAYVYGSRLVSGLVPDGERTKWRYQVPETYVISILERFSIAPEDGLYIDAYCTRSETTRRLLEGSTTYIFIELCNFAKKLTELRSDLDNWLYVLKNMSRMNKIPQYLKKSIFQKLFQISEYINLPTEEKEMYDRSMKYQWDLANIMDTQKEEGIAEGMEKGKAEIVCRMIRQGQWTDCQIAEVTGVGLDVVENLRRKETCMT
jgi:conserved hypothetical protein (putative transposase or invertase)